MRRAKRKEKKHWEDDPGGERTQNLEGNWNKGGQVWGKLHQKGTCAAYGH